MSVAAVVLAAGGGSRFGNAGGGVPKLLAPFRGKPLVYVAVEAASGAGLDETIVVWGAVDLRPALPDTVTSLCNTQWRSGLATSLGTALAWCAAQGHDAVVVGLGDAPLVPTSAWRAVARSTAPLAVATFSGRRHPPVRIERGLWNDVPRSGDVGARMLWRSGTPVLEVHCQGSPRDVDLPEELTELEQLLHTDTGTALR